MADNHAIRRLEVLSDIVFGVAITFMAYRLPPPDRMTPAPSWAAIEAAYGRPVLVLALSFSIAVVFWFSHRRRLAIVQRPGEATLLLNFAFLFFVILLPITSDLFGAYGRHGAVIELYSIHLALISSVNFVLWLAAVGSDRTTGAWRLVVAPGIVAANFLVAAVLAFWRDDAAQFLMFCNFLGPLVTYLLIRRRGSPPLPH